MNAFLASVFIGLSALAVAFALFSLWQSLRQLALASGEKGRGGSETSDRQALEAEKQTLLRTLKDLEFERDVGKLSETDFEALNRRARGRAREVLEALDQQVEGYRAQAQKLLDAELSRAKLPERGGAGADAGERSAAAGERPAAGDSASAEPAADSAARVSCPACKTDNESDALFCKKCGGKLGLAAATPDAEGAEPAAQTDASEGAQRDG